MIDKVMDLDMEPKLESLEWTSICKRTHDKTARCHSWRRSVRRCANGILEVEINVVKKGRGEAHGPRLYVCQAPNAFIYVSSVAPPKHQMRLYVCHQMR